MKRLDTAHLAHAVVDDGLGNSSYIVDLGDGRALAVDPSRDLRQVHATTEKLGLQVAVAAETHLHADFISGARQLAADGASIVASAADGRSFDHVGLRDGDEVDVGGLTMRALATPGHTDGHLAYLLLDGQRPLGVFSGGSLLVASAARTDLVDPDRTEELARAQYHSIRRLLELPDDLPVWPTHGAGSFCSAPAGTDRTTTIGAEKDANPLLVDAKGLVDEDTFVARLLGGLGTYPSYFRLLSEINRRGPKVLEKRHGLPQLPALDVHRRRSAGAVVIDVRSVQAFGESHIPGSMSNTLRPQFASWLGWLVPIDAPLIFVRDPAQDPDEITYQATKIGFDNIVGELAGGLPAWATAGLATSHIPVLDPEAAAAGEWELMDVRQDSEYAAGHLHRAIHIELGSLPAAARSIPGPPERPLLTMCGHGERAMTAASVLAGAGRRVGVLAGSPEQLADALGNSLARGQ